jgi:hypothetical protein
MSVSEVKQALKKLEDDYDKVVVLAKKFGMSFSGGQEAQEKFARQQADIQIQLTACFTFIVLMATFALGAWQIISTPVADLPSALVGVREIMFYLFGLASLASGVGTAYSYWKMQSHRKALDS